MDPIDALVNIAGFAIIILVTYMIFRNVVQPRFLFPWRRKREKEQLLEKGRWLLDEAELDDDDRERVGSAVNTLAIRGGTGESWTRDDPFNAARADINAAWQRHGTGNTGEHTLKSASGS